MRNELIKSSNLSIPDGDLLHRVLEGSKSYQLQRYEVPRYDAKQGMGQLGWYKMLLKTPVLFSREQFSVFKALHQWRDNVAREDDDSVHYVMSNHALLSLSREMPTKREKFMAAASQISASMRNRQDEIVKVISQAREAGKDGPEMRDVLKELDEIAAEQRRQRWAERERASVIYPVVPKQLSPVPTVQPTILAKRPHAVDASVVRAGESKFWGSTLGGQIQQRPVSIDMELRLALPLPPLTAEIFSDNASFAPGTPVAQTPDSAARPAHAFIPASSRPKLEEDDVFVIKELGGRSKKRKLSEEADSEEDKDDFGTQQDSLAVEEMSARAVTNAEKAKRKARKEAKKSLQEKHGYPLKSKREAEMEGKEAAAAAEEAPFDYANAPSVLHAQDEQQGKKGKKDRKQKKNRGFDPYAKSMDAPKGLPRAQREKAGRTATFKSQK
jgi:exosome complex exonuclease RRP6